MILDLRKLERSGKESEDFFFLYTPKENLVSIPNAETLAPIKVQGKVTLTGSHACYIEGEIVYTIKGECNRCLKETEREYLVSFNEEVDGDDEESYPLKNDTVDLSKIVDDAIVMNAPLSFLCDEDCKGLCPKCGKDLNTGDCDCEK